MNIPTKSYLGNNISRVTSQSAKETTVTVHDNESEAVVVCEQVRKGLGVEFIVTEVQGGVDWLEGLEIDCHFFLLSLVRHNSTTVHY